MSAPALIRAVFSVFVIAISSTAHADEVNQPIQMQIGDKAASFSTGLQCDIHITDRGNSLNDALPCVKVPSGWFIEMNGEPQKMVPALIQVGDGKNCLVAYNELCLIRGKRLDVQ